MGAGCHCVNNSGDEEEFRIGQGMYSFKKIVIINKKFIINFNIQLVPRNNNEKIFYGKTEDYEEIKNKLDRTSSLYSQANPNYNNGNVEVIIPCPTSK